MIYMSISLLLFSLFLREVTTGPFDRKNYFYNVLLLVFIAVAAFRWKVGGDSISYQETFEDLLPNGFKISKIIDSQPKFEPLFLIAMAACKAIFNEFWGFQLIHAVFINVTLFYFFRKYTPYKFTAVFLYSFFLYFYFNMEILRESIAVCIFVWMYPIYKKKKWIRYYILATIAIFFHFSAFILLFFPFFRTLKINTKTLSLLFLLSGVLILFSSNIAEILALLPWDSIAFRFFLYSNVNFNIFGVLFAITMYFILPYILYYYNEKQGKFDSFPDMVIIYFLIVAIYVSIRGFGRFINYLSPFMLVYFTNTIVNVLSDRYFRQWKVVVLGFILFIPFIFKASDYWKSTSHWVSNTRNINLWYPYSSIFKKEEYPFREVIYRESLKQGFEDALKKL